MMVYGHHLKTVISQYHSKYLTALKFGRITHIDPNPTSH